MLVVGRSVRGIAVLRKELDRISGSCTVASDDGRVQSEARRHKPGVSTCFIESIESFYRVAGDVLSLLDKVNVWLERLSSGEDEVSRELLHWIRHVEGGLTTQRIQDALLLIHSYQKLFDEMRPERIILVGDEQTRWEDDLLLAAARARGLPVSVRGKGVTAVLPARSRFSTIARPAYHIATIATAKLRARKPSRSGAEKEIVFQLCNSRPLHVNNIAPIMKEVLALGYRPVALCWRAAAGGAMVSEQGLPVVHLESFVTPGSVLSAYRTASVLLARAMRRKAEFLADRNFSYEGVPLGEALWPSVVYFLTGELPLRLMLEPAMKSYLAEHPPVAAKLWGGGTLFEGASLVRHLPPGSNALLMFWFWITSPTPTPYESKFEPVDLFLAAGKTHEDYLAQLGIPADKVVRVGVAAYDHLSGFRRTTSPEESRRALGIPAGYAFHVLLDAGTWMRGYMAASEQAGTTRTILEFAERNPSVAVLIKPHPTHEAGLLESQLEGGAGRNVYVIDKKMLPYHALNASDVLVTKYSTLGVEAMVFEVPVISLLLDREPGFKVFGDGAEYLFETSDLAELLQTLADDDAFRKRWRSERLRHQAEFLTEYRGETGQPTAKLAAAAIDRFIRERTSAPAVRAHDVSFHSGKQWSFG